MRQIGRELERKQGVIKLQMLADIEANGRISRQFKQAAVVFRQL